MENKNLLIIPMWTLYNMKDLEDINFDINLSDYIKRGYNLTKRKELYEVLEWAEDNPNYSFINLMDNAPSVRKIKFTNKEIYLHLMNFKSFMENTEFSLLIDNRPTNLPWER